MTCRAVVSTKSIAGFIAKIYGTIKAAKDETGRATLSCKYDPYQVEGVEGTGFTYTATVYVEDPRLEADGEEGPLVEKKAGSSYALNLLNGEKYVLQSEGVFQPVIFSSSKPSVVFVDEAGVVYARGNGKANLVARVNGRKITVKVTIG